MEFVRVLFEKSVDFINHEGVTLSYRAGEFYHVVEADAARLLEQGIARAEHSVAAFAEEAEAAAAEDRKKADDAGDPVAPAPQE